MLVGWVASAGAKLSVCAAAVCAAGVWALASVASFFLHPARPSVRMTAAAKIVKYDVFDMFLLRKIPGDELHFVSLSCREPPSLSKTAQCGALKRISVEIRGVPHNPKTEALSVPACPKSVGKRKPVNQQLLSRRHCDHESCSRISTPACKLWKYAGIEHRPDTWLFLRFSPLGKAAYRYQRPCDEPVWLWVPQHTEKPSRFQGELCEQ